MAASRKRGGPPRRSGPSGRRPGRSGPPKRGSGRTKLLVAAGAAAALLLVVVLVAIALSGDSGDGSGASSGGEVAGGQEATRTFAGIPQRGLAVGRANAPVTLVEFLDPQCPVCARFSQEMAPVIVNRYVRPGRVRMEMRPLRFLGDDSVLAAASYAAAAQQNRAWQFADVFFANQGVENSGYVTKDFVRSIAGATPGVDPDRLVADTESADVEDVVARSEREAQSNGVNSTPSFLVGPTGGQLEPYGFEGLQPLDDFRARLDQALKQAG